MKVFLVAELLVLSMFQLCSYSLDSMPNANIYAMANPLFALFRFKGEALHFRQ